MLHQAYDVTFPHAQPVTRNPKATIARIPAAFKVNIPASFVNDSTPILGQLYHWWMPPAEWPHPLLTSGLHLAQA